MNHSTIQLLWLVTLLKWFPDFKGLQQTFLGHTVFPVVMGFSKSFVLSHMVVIHLRKSPNLSISKTFFSRATNNKLIIEHILLK